jgi:hypothetical protein
MSIANHRPGGARAPGLLAAACLAAACLAAGPATAADPAKADAKRTEVGKWVADSPTLLRREEAGKPWQIAAANEPLFSGDLLLGGGGTALTSPDGSISLVMMGDLAELSPYPVRETAVVLHNDPKRDLDLTLDRGRLDVVNNKERGPAHVRVHLRNEPWELTLEEPGASIALETYGRWPRGVSFTRDPGPKDVPTTSLIFLVLKGEVRVRHGIHLHLLKAPPGPAMIEWDNVTGQDAAPHFLDELPPWARQDAAESAIAKKKRALLAHFRELVQGKSLGEALDEMVTSDDAAERKMAVFIMAALDELPRLAKALRETRHLDVWDNGVLALRHWIGRAPGQDQVLYQVLIDTGKYSPRSAEAALQLLHSFGEADLARAETYEVLIDYLESEKLMLRGLAYWHLSRLVPAGREFGYNPLDPKEKRAEAVEKWRKLIPTGQLPPAPKVQMQK